MFLVGVLTLAAVCVSTSGTGEGAGCKTSPTVVGERGVMTFTFRPDLDMTSDTFHTYVIQDGHTANVVQCDRRDKTGITCDTIHKAFKPTSIVNNTLTLTADDVSLDLAGVYTLWTMVGGSTEDPVKCTFVVNNGTEDTGGDTTDGTAVAIAVPVVLILVVALCVVGFFLYKRRKRQMETRDRHESEPADPMLPSDVADEHPEKLQFKRWYFEHTSPDFETQLAKFWRNGEGSFLIAKDHGNLFTLAVLDAKGHINRPRITKTDSGYKVNDTDTDPEFPTLTELVTYYRKHDIEIGKRNFGKLDRPFEVKPEEVGYAGKLPRDETGELFKLRGKKPGNFLIRDNNTFPDCYTLAVYDDGGLVTFRIKPYDEGFFFEDAKGKDDFKSLAELVQYYQENTLDTVKGYKGKLGLPVKVRDDGEEDK